MSSEDTKQSCNKFSILGESGAVSPVGKKGATKVFKHGRKSRLFFMQRGALRDDTKNGRGADYTAPGSQSFQFLITF